MTIKEAIKSISKEVHKPLTEVSKELGYPFITGVSNTLNKGETTTVLFAVKVLSSLGYELVLKPKKRGLTTYVIDNGEVKEEE